MSDEAHVASSAIPFDPFVRRGKWWLLSTMLALILVAVLGLLWTTWPEPAKPDPELVDRATYSEKLGDLVGENGPQYSDSDWPSVETGIFIQTFDFESSTDIRVTGYVWQRFNGDFEEAFAQRVRDGMPLPVVDLTTGRGEQGTFCEETLPDDPEKRAEARRNCVRPGIVFPDMVDSRFGVNPAIIGYALDESRPEASESTTPASDPSTTLATTTTSTTTPVVPTAPGPTTVEGSTPTVTTIPESTLPAMNVATTEPATAPSTTIGTTGGPAAPFDRPDANGNVSAAAPGTTTIVWYFEGPVRQNVPNDDFPFDRKIIRFRLWAEDFESGAILVPDYRGYPCTGSDDEPAQEGEGGTGNGWVCTKTTDTFGVDQTIVLDEFERPHDSYFDVTTTHYTSNLGLPNFDQVGYPDLSYNLVLERKLLNAFVSELVPFIVAAGLAFAVLMTITGNRDRGRLFSFSTTQVMTTLSGLFFAVLLAHLRLRGRFDGVVYFEVFYFVMYLVLLGVAIDAVLVTAPQTRNAKLLRYGDNLIPQLLFWPTLITSIVVVTAVVRYEVSSLWSWISWP